MAAALAALFAVAAAAGAYHGLGVELEVLAGWLPPCPFRALSGIACPGCGMGRALLHLAQLRLGEATALHPFAPLVAAALVAATLRPPILARVPSSATLAALAALLALWVARLAGGSAV